MLHEQSPARVRIAVTPLTGVNQDVGVKFLCPLGWREASTQ